MPPIVAAAAISAGAGIFGAHAASGSANKAAKYQAGTANRAADIEAKSTAEGLQFLREQEAQRQKEWQSTQDRNYGIYQDETAYGRQQRAQRYADLGPYRNLGTRAIGQLLQPIQQRPAPGSVGAMMGTTDTDPTPMYLRSSLSDPYLASVDRYRRTYGQ